MGVFRWKDGWTVRRGMLLSGVVVCACTALSLLLPVWVSGIVLLLLILSLLFILLIPRLRYAVVVFCIVIAVLSVFRGVAYMALEVPPVSELVGTTDSIVGQVVERPSSGKMYTLRITQSQALPIGTRLLLYCSDRVSPRENEMVSTMVEYRSLYDSQTYRRADGIYLQAFPTSFDDAAVVVTSAGTDTDWTTWLYPVRDHLAAQINETLHGDEGALLIAMCLGDKSELPASVSDAFRACGLPHLIAVSGLHMTVIAGSLQTGLRWMRLRKRLTIVATLLVIFLYMWLVGFTPSVVRSGLMYGIVLVGMLFRRQSDALNSLGLALTTILLLTPNALYDLGFWLSFGSTAGIVCIYPRLRLWLQHYFAFIPSVVQRPVGWITDSLAITAAATLPLLPLLALTFRELSLVSPLANLLTVIPSGWMLVLGMLGVLLRCTVVLSGIGELMLLLAGLVAKYMIAVSESLGSIPGATLLLQQSWQLAWVVGACAVLTVGLCCLRARILRRTVCCLLAILVCAHTGSLLLNSDVTSIHILSVNDSAVIRLEHKGQSAVFVQNLDCLYMARSAMEADGYRYPTLLLIGDGELAYEAYLTEWMETYPDTQTVISGQDKAFATQYPTIMPGDTVHFWKDHSICVTVDGWWLLTMGETTLLVAPPGVGQPPSRLKADGYVLFADTMPAVLSLDASGVFCICADDTTVTADGPIERISNDESCRVITDGNGHFKTLI